MKSFLFILSFLFSISIFGRTIIVHDKCDKRLMGYKDSIACYYYGIFQVESAKKIDRHDTAQGRKLMEAIDKKLCQLNQVMYGSISRIGVRNDLEVLYRIDVRPLTKRLSTDIVNEWMYYTWLPEVYAKPVLIVIYEKPEEPKPSDTIKSIPHKYETVFLTQKKDSVIWIPSGKKISKDAFITRYGKETYGKLVKQ